MPRVATGVAVAFVTSAYAPQIRNVDWSGISRPSIDTTHLATTTARTFIPGQLYDPGQLVLQLLFQPDVNPPIAGAAETINVDFPFNPGETTTKPRWSASGFMTQFEIAGQVEEGLVATATFKLSGAITMTDGA